MDTEEGERHPELGARLMASLFGKKWGDFCLYHSRYYSRRFNLPMSKLCAADKLAFGMTPKWLYLKMTAFTGELDEYMENAIARAATSLHLTESEKKLMATGDPSDWWDGVESHLTTWAQENK